MASKPEMTYKEVMIEMGRVWNHELDEEQKAPFLAQRQQLMVEWNKAMDAYKLGDDVKKGGEGKVTVEGDVLGEKGDLRSKEEQSGEVTKVEQGEEFQEEDLKKDGDMEIEEREEEGVVGIEGNIKGELGDLGIKEDALKVEN